MNNTVYDTPIKFVLIVAATTFFSTNAGANVFQPITVTLGYCHNINLAPQHSHLSYETPYNLTCSYAFRGQSSGQKKISIIGNFVEFNSAKMNEELYTITTEVKDESPALTIGKKDEVTRTHTNEISSKNTSGTITINGLMIDRIGTSVVGILTIDYVSNPYNNNLLAFCNDSNQPLQINCSTIS